MIGIIVALEEELDVVLQSLAQERTVERAGMTFHVGYYMECPIVAVICGVGKVNAAVCTQLLISEFNTHRIINLGVAGALDPHIQ